MSELEGWSATAPDIGPVDQRDDAEVIAASCGQPEQFGVVFDRHVHTVSRYVSRRLGAALAEDLVAETFVAAFRQRDRYDTSRIDARPWLLGIATNLIRHHHRDEARKLKALSKLGIDPVAESFTEAVEVKVAVDAATRGLAAAIAELNSQQRDVLLLTTWGELTYAETAVALRLPVGTVRSRLSRAREVLRAALGDASPFQIEEEHDDGRA